MRLDCARNRLLIVLPLLSMSGLLAVYIVLLTFWVNLANFVVVLTAWLTTAEVQHRKNIVQATCDFCFIASVSSLVDAFTLSYLPSPTIFSFFSNFFKPPVTA